MDVRIANSSQLKGVVSFARIALIVAFVASAASRAQAVAVSLGVADPFAVLASSTIKNTGPTLVSGDIGVHAGTAITGFFGTIENDGPGSFIGTSHQNDAVAGQAKTDAETAYVTLAGLTPDASLAAELGGQTLVPGVYNLSSSAQLTGTLSLDGPGQYVIQIGTALTTASDSVVALLNGADACDVWFVVGSAATLGTGTDFNGNIIALTEAITLNTGATIDGRLISLGAAVNLDDNIVTVPMCAVVPDMAGIGVSGPGGIVSNGSAAAVLNGTDFGTAFVGDLIEHTFTITNTGTGPLDLGALNITGDFALIGLFPTSIAAGDSANFAVALDTTTTGLKVGTIMFDTNAPGGPFTFHLAGNVIPSGAVVGVPEPGASVLLLVGMLFLIGPRHKRE